MIDEDALVSVVKRALREFKNEVIEEKIYGITGLAKFLNCSVPTAQTYKNSGLIPYRQIGNKIEFDSAEVLKALSKEGIGVKGKQLVKSEGYKDAQTKKGKK